MGLTVLKRCFKCHTSKPLSAFYRHSAMNDGHLGKCKECTKLDDRRNDARHIEQYRQTHPEMVERQQLLAKIPPQVKKWACGIVARAIRKGILIRPLVCPSCGLSDRKVQTHHDDYEQPLLVKWSCSRCHLPQEHCYNGHRFHGGGRPRWAS